MPSFILIGAPIATIQNKTANSIDCAGAFSAAESRYKFGLNSRRLIERQALKHQSAKVRRSEEQLLKDITGASAFGHQKQVGLDDLLKGRDASGTAVERAEANAELLSIAERLLLRAAASRLAARTIERHRAMVQDLLISRAGTLLAMATDDAFSGLGVAYGDDDQPILVARRNNGEPLSPHGR